CPAGVVAGLPGLSAERLEGCRRPLVAGRGGEGDRVVPPAVRVEPDDLAVDGLVAGPGGVCRRRVPDLAVGRRPGVLVDLAGAALDQAQALVGLGVVAGGARGRGVDGVLVGAVPQVLVGAAL